MRWWFVLSALPSEVNFTIRYGASQDTIVYYWESVTNATSYGYTFDLNGAQQLAGETADTFFLAIVNAVTLRSGVTIRAEVVSICGNGLNSSDATVSECESPAKLGLLFASVDGDSLVYGWPEVEGAASYFFTFVINGDTLINGESIADTTFTIDGLNLMIGDTLVAAVVVDCDGNDSPATISTSADQDGVATDDVDVFNTGGGTTQPEFCSDTTGCTFINFVVGLEVTAENEETVIIDTCRVLNSYPRLEFCNCLASNSLSDCLQSVTSHIFKTNDTDCNP